MRWAAICTVALLSGCAWGGDREPRVAGGAAGEIAELVQQLELSARRGDPQVLCEDLLTPRARDRAGGARCPLRVRRRLVGLREARVALASVDVSGRQAVARLRTQAAGERSRAEVLELRRVRGQWRVDGLRP